MPANPSILNPTEQRIAELTDRANRVLAAALPDCATPPIRLHRAMAHAVTAGGKRVRPLLAYAAGEALEMEPEQIDPIAAALEMIHAYSLVHDDLPAMDDDDMRRGQPSCHIAFDEATAILAGDALQALAFEILAGADAPGYMERGSALVVSLARACGSQGMAGGQSIDLEAVGQAMNLDQLKQMHALKTGALIAAAVTMPAELDGGPSTAAEILAAYGRDVGLAFQIKDDILDIEGSTQELGKPQGSDQARNKPTFPALLGLDQSKRLASDLLDAALADLHRLPGDTTLLAYLARFIIERSH